MKKPQTWRCLDKEIAHTNKWSYQGFAQYDMPTTWCCLFFRRRTAWCFERKAAFLNPVCMQITMYIYTHIRICIYINRYIYTAHVCKFGVCEFHACSCCPWLFFCFLRPPSPQPPKAPYRDSPRVSHLWYPIHANRPESKETKTCKWTPLANVPMAITDKLSYDPSNWLF